MTFLGRLLGGILLLVLFSGTVLAVDGDVVFKREGPETGTPPAVFPHWIHRIRYKCYACHPGLFGMKAGAVTITMDAIGEGKSCGACHNGGPAAAVDTDTCNACHPGE
jgi:c(7)-type cytochrome triheme protein